MQPKQLHRFKPLNSTNTTNRIDFTKYFAYIVPVLIFFGVSKLSFFYNYFNIRIISFLDFGEILTSFFNFILSLFMTSISLVAVFSIASMIEEKNKRKPLVPMLVFISFFLVAGFLVFVLKLEYFGVGLMVMLFAAISIMVFFGNEKEFPKPLTGMKKVVFITVSFIILMIAIWFSAFLDFDRVTHRKIFYGVKVTYIDNKAFLSDSTNYYIGNTSNYLFIYNEKNSKTQVQKMNDVKFIEFPRRRGWGF